MSLALVNTRASFGIKAPAVTVEVHISNGLPGLSIVGLPEAAVKESKDRVRSALLNSQFEFPDRRVTINLAPADIPKDGSRFDLPIALGILVASKQLPASVLDGAEFVGELALTGKLRRVSGILTAAIACGKEQRVLFCASGNAQEASVCEYTSVKGADSLVSLCEHLQGKHVLEEAIYIQPEAIEEPPNINEVHGQPHGKRALTIAAAGRHNLLMFGPPGTGKTLLASRLPGLLPKLSNEDALAVAAIYSIGTITPPPHRQPPFRSPHHTASAVALVGGGSHPKPGEISLAHNGVLFLDELPEFPRHVLEVLREPLESGEIRISRATAQCQFPAKFQLIAAMNPCPCGYYGSQHSQSCRCSPDQVKRYRHKISGPLLDRIDLHIGLQPIPIEQLHARPEGPSSQELLHKIEKARAIQIQRQGKTNSELGNKEILQYCPLSDTSKSLLNRALETLKLSSRAYHRILRVARTIADLDGNTDINPQHISEALSLRQFDRPIS